MSTKELFTRLFLPLATLLALAGILGACSAPPGTSSASAQSIAAAGSTITVVGQGTAHGVPDQAHIVVGVEVFADTVQAATEENAGHVAAVIEALLDEGIARKDIQTVNYSVWTEQIYGENGPQGIAGYRVTNQVQATIRDREAVADVLTAVIDAGANNIHGISFSVSDPAALEAQAREAAVADARARARSLAELAGVSLGEIQMISEVIGNTPPPLPPQKGGALVADAGPIFSPGELTYQSQIMVTFAIR